MTTIIINPGTGPVDAALLRCAWKNIRAFRRALKLEDVTIERAPKGGRAFDAASTNKNDRHHGDDDGRYTFILRLGKRGTYIDMPGCSIGLVRGRLLNAPRLYVDQSSWWWEFAIGQARSQLTGKDE